MTDTMAPLVPAGWYPDPWDASSVRWWSGAEWTAHTNPKYAPAESPGASHPVEQVAVAPTGSPQTAGIWLLAFLPLMNLALITGSALLVEMFGLPVLAYIGTPVSLGLAVLFAFVDARALRRAGYHPASLLWLLALPPLGYLIARGRAVRAQGGRAWPSELVYISTLVVAIAAVTSNALEQTPGTPVAADGTTGGTATHAGETYFAGTVVDEQHPEAPGIEWLISRTIDPAGSVTVDCTETALVMDFGMPFRCTATDATGARALIEGEITTEGEVYFRYGILPDPDDVHGTGNGILVAQQNSAGSIGDERLPWQPQIEQAISAAGRYEVVDCSESAGVIDHASTFDCVAAISDDHVVRLSVTITEVGNIGFTEYELDGPSAQQPA